MCWKLWIFWLLEQTKVGEVPVLWFSSHMNVASAGYVCLMRQLCLWVASVLDASFQRGEHIQQLLLFSKRQNAHSCFLQGKPETDHVVFWAFFSHCWNSTLFGNLFDWIICLFSCANMSGRWLNAAEGVEEGTNAAGIKDATNLLGT